MWRKRMMLVAVALMSLALCAGQTCAPPGGTDQIPGGGDSGDNNAPIDGGTTPGDGTDNSDGTDGTDGSDGTDDDDGSDDSASEATALFDEVWSTFDQRYSYFNYKGIDWNQVRTQYRDQFDQDMTADEFARKLRTVLNVLHDWHVDVAKPDGTYLDNDMTYQTNYPPTLLTAYTLNQAGYTTVGNDVIFHAWVGEDIAHVVIDTLETSKFESVSDQDIEQIFQTYQNASGMIIDIRANSGGNEENAKKIASRFVNSDVTYGFVQTRNGPNHDDFDPAISKVLSPGSGTHFDGEVVCLIGQRCLSSAEWFTLMMRAANALLIGDTTRGGSGNPSTFQLSNGVTYRLSTWVAATDDGTVFEDVGIDPDIFVDTSASFDETRDYVLEEALDYLTLFGGF